MAYGLKNLRAIKKLSIAI